jgi:hypothetical protein
MRKGLYVGIACIIFFPAFKKSENTQPISKLNTQNVHFLCNFAPVINIYYWKYWNI